VGTAVFEPEQAVVFTLEGIEGLDALGAGGEAPSFLIVGEDVYLGIGGTYLPIPTTGEQSAQFESLFDALRPETLLGSVTGEVQGMEEVGTETKNGVSAVHLQADEATRDALAEQFGAEADFPFDAWVAEDGDYLVSLEMGNPGSEDEFGISINISDVDDPGNVVERP
ncbi:MAG: LppX_LprAFG lipoprotein, partial [Chloroflexi bacterium]|nr:LppX_LprAFG lipoprotein [Chloroflexota bacterium]